MTENEMIDVVRESLDETVRIGALREFVQELVVRMDGHVTLSVTVADFPLWLAATDTQTFESFRNEHGHGTKFECEIPVAGRLIPIGISVYSGPIPEFPPPSWDECQPSGHGSNVYTF